MQTAPSNRHRWAWAVVMIVAVGLFPRQVTGADPTLSLGDEATIRIPAGSTNGVTQVMMKAENLAAQLQEAQNPDLKDLGGVGVAPSTTVEFKNAVMVDAGATGRAWLWTAAVQGLPANSNQKRTARLAFGKLEQYVEYHVTNLSPAAFTWSVTSPGVPWLVWFGYPNTYRATTFVVTTGDYPASNLRLAQSTLRDGLGLSQLAPEDLELCETAAGGSGNFNVNARSNRTFYVRLKEKDSQWFGQNGKYTGTLSFAVNERPELQTVNVTVHASSFAAKLVGAILIGFGIWVAWWAGVRARARAFRLEALKPAAALRESIPPLRADLDELRLRMHRDIPGDREKGIGARLEEIDNSLTSEALDARGLLPQATPNPWAGSADPSAKLKEYLVRQGEWITGLAVLVRDGMKKLVEDWEDHAMQPAILTALQALNEKSGSAIDRAKAEEAVKAVIGQYNAHIQRESDPGGRMAFAPPSLRHLNWEIAQIYTKGWMIWGILTWLGGLAVLILPNPGFGTLLDLVFCVFWGFGLPTGIDKVQQLGPGGIATTIGVSVPKTTP